MQLLKSEWPFLLPALLVLLATLRSKYVPVDPSKPRNWWQTGILYLQLWLTSYAPKGTVGLGGGTLSLPFVHVPSLEKPGQSAPGGVAKALLPFLIGASFGLMNCGYCAQQANVNTARCEAQRVTVNCGAPEVVKALVDIIPRVMAALVSSDFTALLNGIVNDLEQQGIHDGWQLVTCAIHNVQSKAKATADEAAIYARGQSWIDAHPSRVK